MHQPTTPEELPRSGSMSLQDDIVTELAVEARSALHILAQLPLFHDLDQLLLARIAGEVEWFSVPGGTTLFEAGEPADAMYFVITGRLGAYVLDDRGKPRLVGRVAPGESVGEMG